MGFAIGLPSVVTRGVGSEALQCGTISVNSPFVSPYCTRTLKSVHDMGSSFAPPNHIGHAAGLAQIETGLPASPGPDEPQHQRRTADLCVRGLNYQIEHHLFPSMARPKLPSV